MTLNRLQRGLAAASLMLAALALGACGGEITGRAVPEARGAASDTLLPEVPEADAGGTVDIDVEIGECVELTGTVADANVVKAPCGSAPANYKVIGKAPTNAQCVSDADSYYYETLMGDEQGALCLDIDWVVGGCMELADDQPSHIDCSTRAREGVRVAEIVTDVTDVEKCSTPSGFVYDERRFAVCTDDL
ncbi:LppU family putative lipoprotein [Rhodococcus sp. NPDC055112]